MQSRFLPRSVAAGGQKARRKDRALRNLGVEELKQGGLLQPHAPLSLTPPAPLPHADPSQLHQAPLQQSACPRPCLRLQITLQIHKRPPQFSGQILGGASDAAPSFRWAPSSLPKADPEQPFHPHIYGDFSLVPRKVRAPHFHPSVLPIPVPPSCQRRGQEHFPRASS